MFSQEEIKEMIRFWDNINASNNAVARGKRYWGRYKVKCPHCKAEPYMYCTTPSGKVVATHKARNALALLLPES